MQLGEQHKSVNQISFKIILDAYTEKVAIKPGKRTSR